MVPNSKIAPLVRLPNPYFLPNPAPTDRVCFSMDFVTIGPLWKISGGYQADILERFEKFKMADKMAAKINFLPIWSINSCKTTFLTNLSMRNLFLRLFLCFDVNINGKFKMAVKLAAKINFLPICSTNSCNTTFLTNLNMENPFLGLFITFHVKVNVRFRYSMLSEFR